MMNPKLIGLKLTRLRHELGLTTTQLAKKVNLSQAQISRLENGKQGFRSKTLVRLSQAMGVKPVFFFIGEEEVPSAGKVFEGAPKYGSKRSATLSRALKYPDFSDLVEKMAESFLGDKVAFKPVAKVITMAIDAPRIYRRDAGRVLRGNFVAVPRKKKGR